MQKPKSDIYTAMLILSLLAIIVGCAFLYAEIASYNGQINGPTSWRSTPVEADSAWAALPQLAPRTLAG